MIGVVSVYEEVRSLVNAQEGVELSFSLFNILSESAENAALSFYTGGLSGIEIPANFTTQKSRDILSVFIKKKRSNVSDGNFPRPEDYHTSDVFYTLGNKVFSGCGKKYNGVNTIIDIVDAVQYNELCQSYIPEINPTVDGPPIAKLDSDIFSVIPMDIGPCVLEYISVPAKAKIASKTDTFLNRDVVDSANSIDYLWHPEARQLIVWLLKYNYGQYSKNDFLVQTAISNRQAIK